MTKFEQVLYETPRENIARITMNRPERRNAQNTDMLYEVNDAFDIAARDDNIKVIIMAGAGKDFSSGHDLRESDHLENQDKHPQVTPFSQHHRAGAEGRIAREEEIYLGFCERWRSIPKPTIAQVQGNCISGGLMLCWPCDMIIASDDAVFQDVTVAIGVAGVEYFGHPWEVGSRKAKEMLFTGAPISAEEARMLGMVNRVVPRADLESATLELAETIAKQPSFALKMAKMAVNAAEDAQGRPAAFQTAFALHHLAHSHWMEVGGYPVYVGGMHANVKKHVDEKKLVADAKRVSAAE
jgi:enoyl-CoA hydratase